MRPIFVGAEVEVYKRGARDPFRCEVAQLHVVEGRLQMIRVRLPGAEALWFDARDGTARDGWYLAPKHVPAVAA